jgi:hypothetical protein
MNKKLIQIVGAFLIAILPVTVFGTGENARPRSTTSGLLIGENSSAYIGFNGAARVRQQAATVSADQVLQNYGFKATGQDYSVQHATISVTAAEIIAMYTTPKLLIAAQGAGKSIVVTRAAFTITRTSTAFTGGGVVILQYAATANGAGTQSCDSTIAATVVTGAAGTAISVRNGAVISDSAAATTQNVGLYLSNATAVFAAGTGTATVDVWYVVL